MSKVLTIYRFFAMLIFMLMHVVSAAQDYPVNVTTVLTPPYSLYLADYASPESNSLQVIIHLRELDRPEYRVKLRLTIEGQGITLRTSPAYNPPALVLQGGIPEMLTGHDLRHYLNPNNLDFSGISRQEFIRKGTFPEGFYTFRIEVIDYVRNVVVSNPGFANAWIILNDPPLINLPFNNEKVIATDPQNVMFNWTPMHTASPNAAFSTEYEFTLVELYPAGRNPNDAIRTANPIFVTRTQSTSLNYGVMEPLLIPGRRYAFRIKAFDTNGRDLFKNNGYSEVYVFQFGDQCVAPGNISAEAIDPDRIKLSWEVHELHTTFNAKLRKKGNTAWDEQTTYSNAIIFPGLQANTTYEYQVNGGCGTISGAYSPVAMVTTPETDPSEFVCGAPAPTIDLSTTPLQGGLMIDDLIKTADFEISITDVQANADGSYKGYGVAFLPWLNFASVKVKFSNIKVNDQYRVYDGIVTTMYSKNSRFVAEIPGKAEDSPAEDSGSGTGGTVPGAPDEFDGIDTTYAGVIAAVMVNESGQVVITDANGSITVVERPRDSQNPEEFDDFKITDSSGNQYLISKDETIPSQQEGNSEGVQETINNVSEMDSVRLYIISGKQKYNDKDAIFLPFDMKGNITLKAVVENDTAKSPTFVWKGVTSSNSDKATVALNRSTGTSGKKVELNYGKKTISISLNILGAYFERLPEGTSGQKNMYGYDEMDKANPDDDHVSVEVNKETYVELQTSSKKFDGIFLKSDNDQIAQATIDGKKIKIIAKGTDKQNTQIKAYAINDSSTAIAIITVNLYNTVTVNGDIYNAYLTSDVSTKVSGSLNANTVRTEANKYLKYLVVSVGQLNTGVDLPIAYDFNGNGKVDFFKNDHQHELNVIYREFVNNGLSFYDVVRFKDSFTRNWVIMDSVKKGGTYILVKSSEVNKGFNLSLPYGEYNLQSPTGADAETFQILRFNGDTVFITTNSNSAVVTGFSNVHPKTSSITTSHVIVSRSMTAGLSPYEHPSDPTKSRPTLICGNVKESDMGSRMAHELMHGQGLTDVNDNTNIMHYNIGITIGNLPFRYFGLDPVVTGTPTKDPSKPKQNQWELIKGR